MSDTLQTLTANNTMEKEKTEKISCRIPASLHQYVIDQGVKHYRDFTAQIVAMIQFHKDFVEKKPIIKPLKK